MAGYNSRSPTMKRIMKEAAELSSSPSPDYTASPASDTNLFDWHFTLRGPPSSAFADGIYHGRIVLPPQYPLRPPHFRFLTPSGRFEVNREICLSISGHHEETWQPAWGIRTALVALRSFMETNPAGQLGGVDATDNVRKRLAGESRGWKCGVCAGKSCEEILGEVEERVREMERENGGEGIKREDEVVPPEMQMSVKATEAEKKEADEKAEEKKKSEERQRRELEELEADRAAEVLVEAYPQARPVQSVPLPTTTIQMQQHLQMDRQVQMQMQAHRRSNDGVPVWIDRAIAGIVVCLAAMVFKMLFWK